MTLQTSTDSLPYKSNSGQIRTWQLESADHSKYQLELYLGGSHTEHYINWMYLEVVLTHTCSTRVSHHVARVSLVLSTRGLQHWSQGDAGLHPEVRSVQHLLPQSHFFTNCVHPTAWSSTMLSCKILKLKHFPHRERSEGHGPDPRLSLTPPRKSWWPSLSWSHTPSSRLLSARSSILRSSQVRVWSQRGEVVFRHTPVFCFPLWWLGNK